MRKATFMQRLQQVAHRNRWTKRRRKREAMRRTISRYEQEREDYDEKLRKADIIQLFPRN